MNKKFTYAEHGLQLMRKRYLKGPQLPKAIEVPSYMLANLQKIKAKNPQENITSRYNIVVFIEWIGSEIEELAADVLKMNNEDANIVLLIMKMMQINQLHKIQTSELSEQAGGLIAQMLEQTTNQAKIYSGSITAHSCKLISENVRKNVELILSKRSEMILKKEKMISTLLELDLHCIFSNILLNLRRTIRNSWATRYQEIEGYFKQLKQMQAKLYYLSVCTFSATEKFVRQLYQDKTNMDRNDTYCFLIHDKQGLLKIHHYLHEVPLNRLQKDMELISATINRTRPSNQYDIQIK